MTHLTAETIVETALHIIDTEGLNALSMRRLGKDLNVDAKAVYYYFANKDALIEGVLKAAFAEMTVQLTGTWQDQVRHVAHAYFAVANEHPNLLPYLMRFDGTVPVVFEVVEHLARILNTTGLSAQHIAQVIDLFWSFIPSFTMSESYEGFEKLPADRFPVTHALMQEVTTLESDLDLQMDILIWGIEALITQNARASRG